VEVTPILFAPDVDPEGVHPAIWIAIGIAYSIHNTLLKTPVTITALRATEGHRDNSYHYAANTPSHLCQAVDLRTRDMAEPVRHVWANLCKAALHDLGYDVVLESPETTGRAPHLHLEYQPYNKGLPDWAKASIVEI
jgi:hypothetical protein